MELRLTVLPDLVGVAQVEMEGCVAILAFLVIRLLITPITIIEFIFFNLRRLLLNTIYQRSDPLCLIPNIFNLNLEELFFSKRVVLLLGDVVVEQKFFELGKLYY